MGRKSIRENKSSLQLSRERLELSREAASELVGCVTEDRIEKIETGRSTPHADEVLSISDAYGDPCLCSDYCRDYCVIGKRYMPEVPRQELTRIAMETMAAVNALAGKQEMLIRLCADGKITPDEFEDFSSLAGELRHLSGCAFALQMLADKAIRDEKKRKEREMGR